MPAPAAPARSRSMLDIDDEASPRVSTMTRSGGAPSRIARSSSTLIGIAPARNSRPKCFLNASSSETISPTSCAMAAYFCFFESSAWYFASASLALAAASSMVF